MANRLIGKVALVFGAGGPREQWSNGKATAVAFAREGAAMSQPKAESAHQTPATSTPEVRKQAVVVIHGMGEPVPMDTMRSFVDAVWEDDENIVLAPAADGSALPPAG